jgi:hypothetical protein
MPATTGIVARGLKGSTHMHMLNKTGNLDGSFGSISDETLAVEVISDRIIRFKQFGFDNYGSGGYFSWGISTIPIDYVRREQFYTTVFCKENHGLPVTLVKTYSLGEYINYSGQTYLALIDGATGRPDLQPLDWQLSPLVPSGSPEKVITYEICSVAIDLMPTDDLVAIFPGAYVVDPEVAYTIRSEFVTSRAKVFAGATLTTLEVNGVLPNQPGNLLFDLNKDSEEGPIRYVGVQVQNAPNVVNIVTASQNGYTMTITTDAPHGAIPGAQIVISGTTYFNGVFPVVTVPNPTTLIATSIMSQTASQVGVGTLSVIVENLRSTVLLDPSNRYLYDHAIGADLTLMSDKNAYQPSKDGGDYPMFITGVAEGRVFAEGVIETITALGINIEVIIVYPSDNGLAGAGLTKDSGVYPHSDAVFVWGI